MASTTALAARDAAESFVSSLASRQFSALGPLFTADANYWVCGNSNIPWAGDMAASERLAHLPAMHGGFHTFNLETKSLVADGKKAVAEFSVHGKDEKGEYHNDVVMIFEVDDQGKIVSLREYLDNMQALAFIQARSDA